MENDLIKIIEASINAPSGSNSQPWKFRIQKNIVDVIAEPEKDHPILNFRNRGTLIAHGALIENIILSALEFGYEARVVLFPEKNITGRITFSKRQKRGNVLFSAIRFRKTNRKPYLKTKLTQNEKEQLFKSENELDGGKISFVEEEGVLSKIGKLVSFNDLVMLENRQLHKLFFNEIVWTKSEQERKKAGLYLKTMELKFPQEKALKIFKYWPIMKWLNKLGLARKIASDNARIYSSASLSAIIMVENTDEMFLKAGRLLERIWLKATNMGLSLQLITGVIFLKQRIDAGETNIFSQEHISLVRDSYNDLVNIFKVPRDKIIAVLFRIGKADPPTDISSKRKPVIEISKE